MLIRQKHPPLKYPKRRISNLVYVFQIIQILIWTALHAFSITTTATVQKSSPNFVNPFKICWEYQVKNENADYVASDNTNAVLYFATFDGKLKSLNAKSGLLNWQSQIGGKIVSVPVLSDEQIYVLARTVRENNSGETAKSILTVHSLNKTTGITKWRTVVELDSENGENEINSDDEVFYLKASERHLYVITGEGEIISLDAVEGDKIRTNALGLKPSAPPFFNGVDVIFGTAEKHIVSLRENDLTKTIDIKVAVPPTFVIVRQNGGFVWGDGRGFVVAADLNGSADWRFRSGGRISGLLKTPNGLLIVSDDNFIYLLSENGKLIWKKRFAERLFFTPLVVGNYVAVTAETLADVFLIDVKNGKTNNKITLKSQIRLTGSPLNLGGLIVLQTSEGFSAYSTERCPL